MEKSIRRFTRIGCAVVVGMVISHCQLARAGWSVNVNSTTGQGIVTVKVTSRTLTTNVVTTGPLLTYFPSAAINQQSNSFIFAKTGTLPSGADPRTYVQVRGSNYFRTSIQSTNFNNDIGDSPNPDLLPFIIPRSACAGSNVEIIPLDTNSPNSITFQYKANLSDEGSAVLLQVIDTVTGKQKYLVLLVGPYDNTAPGNCEGTVTITGDVNNLNMLLDGHTSTLPINITCPTETVVLSCSAQLPDTYEAPAAAVVTRFEGDTGPYTITYDKLPNQLVIGVTNIVTATATDINGCSVSCQFKVYRQGIVFNGFFSPIGSADGPECQPVRSYRLGSNVALKFKMTCDGQEVTSGIPVITIQRCGAGVVFEGPFQHVNDEWHFNIDSTIIGTNPSAAGTYKFTATLPDRSQHSTVLQFTRR